MSLLPVAAILMSPRRRRNRLAQALLPTLIPGGSAAQRVAVGTVIAHDQVRRDERQEAQVAEQTAAAVQQAKTQNAPITDLTAFPMLARIEVSRPGILSSINLAAGLPGGNGHAPQAPAPIPPAPAADGVAAVNARVDGLEGKIDGIEKTLKAIQDQLGALEKKVPA